MHETETKPDNRRRWLSNLFLGGLALYALIV
jgi:hypothetical protein